MSQADVDRVISRMAVDGGFHALVRADPNSALAPYLLTDEERELVLALAPDHEVHAHTLMPRSSKSALFFGTALSDAAATPAHGAAAHGVGHAAAHAAPGASPVEQAVTWVTAQDIGDTDPNAQAVGSAGNLLQAQGAQAADEAEEEVEEELEAELGQDLGSGGPPA
jgi:hypothetical protein